MGLTLREICRYWLNSSKCRLKNQEILSSLETPDDTEKPGESENPDGETPSEVPETGEAANITVWLLVFAASAILVVLTLFKRKGTAK